MKKLLSAIIITINLLGMAQLYAVPAAPSPVCEVSAQVLDIEKIKTTTAPINAKPKELEYYSVKIKILRCVTYKQEGDRNCAEMYPLDSQKDTILWPDEYDKQPIIKGERIGARIHFEGDERFHGIFLSDIQIEEK